jgi:6-phosphofructokinase 1
MERIRILVVENDQVKRGALVRNVLEPEGYEVVQAGTPEEAEEKLIGTLIHLAIVDVRLRNDDDPNDDSGLRFCRSMDHTVARIIRSGFSDWGVVRSALEPQPGRHRLADGFFLKMEDPSVMLRVIREVIGEEFEVLPEKRIAVLTSGGDSPGMNAAIWAIVRTAMQRSVEVLAVRDGYRGLVGDEIDKLRWNDVSDIMGLGGTILGSARYEDFRDPSKRSQAADNLRRKHVSGLIVVGGDGSMKGAQALAKQMAQQGVKLLTAAIPGTIDNDLYGTDTSLGAESTANAMIDELRNMVRPAQALRRIFVVEVMGRYAGYLALQAALGIGADAVLIPEEVVDVDPGDAPVKDRVNFGATMTSLTQRLQAIGEQAERSFATGKRHGFVILSEGIRLLIPEEDPAEFARSILADSIKRWKHAYRPDVRVQVLGYPVRGVPPSRHDIWLGANLGAAAVTAILEGRSEVMLGWSEEQGVIETTFDDVVAKSSRAPKEAWADRPKWRELLALQESLSAPPKPLL